jgi:hypothetical protein
MSSKSEELTPEERLLKVIQQGKAADATAGASASVSPPAAPPAEKASDTRTDKPSKTDSAEKTAPPPSPVEKPAPKPVAPVPAAEPGGAKLKLAPEAKNKTDRTDQPDSTDRTDKAEAGATPAPQPERGAVIGLRGINRILLAAVVAGILAVAYDLWADRPVAQLSFDGDVALVDKFPQPVALPALDNLMQKVGDRNLFNVPTKVADPKTDRPQKVEAPVANYKLMGVSLDEKQPGESMALIREQNTGNTYFLKTGQRLADSDFTLGSIRPESVTLKTQKGEIELR